MEAGVARAETSPMPPFADGLQDFVGSKVVAGGEGHVTQISLLDQGG